MTESWSEAFADELYKNMLREYRPYEPDRVITEMSYANYLIIWGEDTSGIAYGLCGPSDESELTPSTVAW